MARAPAPTVALLLLLAGLPAPARAQEIPEGAPAQPQAHRDRAQAVGWFRHLLDAVEAVDTPVYRRNSMELKYEWTEKPAGAALG
jgi:hypothetical protein